MKTSNAGEQYAYTVISSPVGKLKLVATNAGLAAVLWENERAGRVRLAQAVENRRHPVLVETRRQLAEYFAGRRKTFSVALDLRGTAFQREVWNALLTIPFGETRSYSEIARQIGKPKAVRAVGAANGRNPVAIFTPCHRVIGAGGELTGFAGGLGAKTFLLEHEGAPSGAGSSASRRPPARRSRDGVGRKQTADAPRN